MTISYNPIFYKLIVPSFVAQSKQELTVHELITLSDLASGSSVRIPRCFSSLHLWDEFMLSLCYLQVRREISELAVLEAFIESLPIPTANRKTAAATTVSENSTSAKERSTTADIDSSSGGKSVGNAVVSSLCLI